jgi:hypothetical protein
MTGNLERGAVADKAVPPAPDGNLLRSTGHDQTSRRRRNVFGTWQLQACAYTLAAAYAVVLLMWYKEGEWLVDGNGAPLPRIDFTYWWIGGVQALHGAATSMYDPAQLKHLSGVLVGSDRAKYLYDFNNFPYPPTVFLLLAPLPLLPYVAAFLIWTAVPLLACLVVVFLIVRRRAAIPLVLASPFGAQCIRWGQFGFLYASLLGGALLALERRPVLAGVLIGCLTYKPQFGILIPVALVAARQWRAFASATITALSLVGISIAVFGIEPWAAFPRGLLANADDVLLLKSGSANSLWIQSVYGLVHSLHGGTALAWLAQGCAIAGAAAVIWLVWRSSTRYSLKAALLSAATLIASPYAWFHDLSVLAIPVAFLARDQIGWGLLRGEQTILLALFGTALTVLVVYGGGMPLGPVIVITLIGVILRRVYHAQAEPAMAAALPEAGRDLSGRAPG